MAALCASALAPPAPAHADPPRPGPVARLQVVVKSIHIFDDRDFLGSGEMQWFGLLCSGTLLQQCLPDPTHVRADGSFSASTGADVTLNRVLPQEGDEIGGEATIATGMPVYAGNQYVFRFAIHDEDPGADDYLGDVLVPVDAEHGWGIGTYSMSSKHGDDALAGSDFSMEYEIRRAPLPDLRVREVTIIDGTTGRFYCGQFENVGVQPAASLPVIVGASIPLATEVGKYPLRVLDLGPLEVGQTKAHCVIDSDIPLQAHTVTFDLDYDGQIPEMDEYNNFGERYLLPARAAPAAPAAAPSPSASEREQSRDKADLVVRAIMVNGQEPDGKDDCKVGKNAVTVIVKNAGPGDAASVVVRLTVDGDDSDMNFDSLAAGQEREVRFEDVHLKKGERTLRAVADPDRAVAESRDDNNEMKRTARCADAA